VEGNAALTVTITLDPDGDTVSGMIQVEAAAARSFVGWVDLVHALDRARAAAAPATAPVLASEAPATS